MHVYIHIDGERLIQWRITTDVFCPLRSIHRLTQLERLDLGSNEFSDVVSLTNGMFEVNLETQHK